MRIAILLLALGIGGCVETVAAQGPRDRRESRDLHRPTDRRDSLLHARRPRAALSQQRWFQRPYPYHLDYYRLRYGGSYAPYFGYLYGTPDVLLNSPAYGPIPWGGEYPTTPHGAYPPASGTSPPPRGFRESAQPGQPAEAETLSPGNPTGR